MSVNKQTIRMEPLRDPKPASEEETAAEKKALEETEPKETESKEPEPDETVPEDGSPEDAKPGEAVPDDGESKGEGSDEAKPEDGEPEGAQSDDAAPEGDDPEDQEPDGPEPENAESEEPKVLSDDSFETTPARRKAPPKKRTRKHRKANWLLRILIIAGVIAAFFGVANLPMFHITQTPVIGNKVVSDEVILELSGIETGKSIFFLNTWSIKHNIKKDLYIENVKIHRQLPSTVEIIIKEREAVAQFVRFTKNNKKRYVVTDKDGMIMSKSKKKKNVTMVNNLVATKAKKGEIIEVNDPGIYHKSMDLIAAAKKGDLYFKRIYIRGSMVNAYVFDDLMCKGRYSNIMDSIENGTLKSVIYTLYQDNVTEGVINIGDNNYCTFTPK